MFKKFWNGGGKAVWTFFWKFIWIGGDNRPSELGASFANFHWMCSSTVSQDHQSECIMFNIFIPLGKLSSFSVNLGQKLVFVSHLTKRSFFLRWNSIKDLLLTFSLDFFLQAFSAQMDALTKFVSLRHIWSHPTSLAVCINEYAHNTEMCKFMDVWGYKCSWWHKCRCTWTTYEVAL